MPASKGKLGATWPTELPAHDMAELMNVSVRHLRDLKKMGIVFAGSKPGMYLFPESLQGYVRYRQKAIAEQGAQSPLRLERAKSASVSRQIAEHKLAELQSDVLTMDEIDESWRGFASSAKRAFLSLPATITKALPHLTPHDESKFRTMIADILRGLADEADVSAIGVDGSLLLPTAAEIAGSRSVKSLRLTSHKKPRQL